MRQSFSNIIIAATVFMVGCMVLITVAYIRERQMMMVIRSSFEKNRAPSYLFDGEMNMGISATSTSTSILSQAREEDDANDPTSNNVVFAKRKMEEMTMVAPYGDHIIQPYVEEGSPTSICPNGFGKTHAIVTAADSTHFDTLRWCLYRASQTNPCETIIVYNLGMNHEEIVQLVRMRRTFGTLIIRPFDFFLYPPYFNMSIAAGEYAFKPVVITEVLKEYEYTVWIDAGTLLNAQLTPLYSFLHERGFYSGGSSGQIKDWTHPGVFKYLKVNPAQFNGVGNCNAAHVAFYAPKALKKLTIPWSECALHKECIAPAGSSRVNHRQDQAALGVLAKMATTTNEGKPFDCNSVAQMEVLFQIQADSYENIVDLARVYQISVPITLPEVREILREATIFISDDRIKNQLSSSSTSPRDPLQLGMYALEDVVSFMLAHNVRLTQTVHFVHMIGEGSATRQAQNLGLDGQLLTDNILGPLSRYSYIVPDVGDWPKVTSPRRGPTFHLYRHFEFEFRQPQLGVPVTAFYFDNPTAGGDKYEQRAKLFVSRMISSSWLVMAGVPLTHTTEDLKKVETKLLEFFARVGVSSDKAAFKSSYVVTARAKPYMITLLADEDRGYENAFKACGLHSV